MTGLGHRQALGLDLRLGPSNMFKALASDAAATAAVARVDATGDIPEDGAAAVLAAVQVMLTTSLY